MSVISAIYLVKVWYLIYGVGENDILMRVILQLLR